MPDFSIRPAQREDIPHLVAFLTPFVKAERLLVRTLTELDELYAHFFLAEADGQLIGCAALEIYSPKLAELRSLAVVPEQRGNGIGRALVETCLARARAERGVGGAGRLLKREFLPQLWFRFHAAR